MKEFFGFGVRGRLTVQIWTWILPRHFNCNGRMRYFSSILGFQNIPRFYKGSQAFKGSHPLTWFNGEWVNWLITAAWRFQPNGWIMSGGEKQRNDITSPPMVMFHHPRTYPFGHFAAIFVRLLLNYHLQGSVKWCTRLKHFFHAQAHGSSSLIGFMQANFA